MTFWQFLAYLTIKPLELLFEIIYSISYHKSGKVVLSIIVLSIVMNLLVLPLYARADAIQAAATKKQKSMEKWIKHIRKTFRGDERLMMLQTYYRQNNYNPMSVLLESVPLLLQIPFFIAAYRFLSGLELLQGVSLGPIRNLAAPDSLFMIGSFPVNILPVIMTAVNIVSGMIYTKGQPLKMKLQINGMAVLFLILLYNSPAGLVIYWTCNNIFSLLKNIVTGIIHAIKEKKASTEEKEAKKDKKAKMKSNKYIFLAGALFAALLLGAYIPTNIIKASTQEFVDILHPQNPLHYLLYSGAYAAGTFLLWLGIFYALAGERGKRYFDRGIWVFNALAVINYLVEGSVLGLISSSLQYSQWHSFGYKRIALSVFLAVAAAIIIILIAGKNVVLFRTLSVAALLSIIVLTAVNMTGIGKDYSKLDYLSGQGELQPEFTLSKNGKNVVLLMLDRGLGTEVPYILNEKPELMESLDGFTYYPNTVSFGAFTNYGSPALYGGYEYSPTQMNARSTEPQKEKHDEALKVLPVLFDSNDYLVTVCDPTYAGYNWIPNLSIYDEYPSIKAYNTEGVYDEKLPEDAVSKEEIRRRNFYCHSLMKAAPLFLQSYLYDSGLYNDLSDQVIFEGDPLYSRSGYQSVFLDWYYALDSLPEMTKVEEGDSNTFLMFTNGTTHEPTLLQEPEYVPKKTVDNSGYHTNDEERFTVDGRSLRVESPAQLEHYCSNMAAFIKLAQWCDYLKANDCYDNTRIIVVADHGRGISHFDLISEEGVDLEYFLPLFLVKDFNAHGFTASDEFMTNADAPSLAVKDLIKDAKNPFTGNLLDGHEKEEGEIVSVFSWDWDITYNNGNTLYPGYCYTVKENPYKMENWTYIGYQ